jgi:hypothetical protein
MAEVRTSGTFQNLAEIVEEGSIPLLAWITEEANPRRFMADDIEKNESLVIERVCLTASGRYTIIARPKNAEEQAEAARWHDRLEKEREKANREGITVALTRPDYILIGWRITYMANLSAYYLRKTGPRFIYSMNCKIMWDHGRGRQTAQADGDGFYRFSRKEAVESIERYPEKFHQCAPLWLLTSIPDLRPRYLEGKDA